jgi:hypothetical protein
VCRAFGISRKTGYKIFSRYKDQGLLPWLVARGARYTMPTSCRTPWRLDVDLKRNKRPPAICPIGPGDAADSRATSAPPA